MNSCVRLLPSTRAPPTLAPRAFVACRCACARARSVPLRRAASAVRRATRGRPSGGTARCPMQGASAPRSLRWMRSSSGVPRRCAATEGADPCRFVTAIAPPPFRVYMAKTQWVPGHRGRCRRSHREWCASSPTFSHSRSTCCTGTGQRCCCTTNIECD